MKLRLAFLWLIFLLPVLAYSQNSTVKGTLQDHDTRAPLSGAQIHLKGSSTFTTTSSATGTYEIKNVPFGSYTLEIIADGYEVITQKLDVSTSNTDVGPVSPVLVDNSQLNQQDNLPTVTLSETDMKESTTQNVAGVLSAGRDPYLSAVAYNFSASRFRNRGYDNENMTLMNGIPVEDLSSSRTLFGTWAGLNDVTRSRESSAGLSASNYTYGSLDGSLNIDAKASRQRKQFAISYANSDRTYDSRLMASYGTGLLTGGWAFSASLSRRWGKEGYVPGTFTDGWSWFTSIEKRIGTNHSISLTHMGANTVNGRANPAVKEAYNLAGTNFYNPNWGYQNGEVRNSRIARQQQPLTILSHEWKINNKSELETSIGYQYGSNSLSGLDWFNAPDPRPDVYRRLPSFIEDPFIRQQAQELWRNDENYRQVDWESIYNANRNSFEVVQDANGVVGNSVSGRRSRYIIEDRVTDSKRVTLSLNYNNVINDNFIFTGGFLHQYQQSENYKRVNDLLGGEFYVDINQWAEQDYPDSVEALQNNLDIPNRILKVGDKFGYDYLLTVNKNTAWAQGQFKYNRFDLFAAVKYDGTEFFRTGKVRNGIFANDSYGDSKKEQFSTFGVKGGVTYKLNGRNYFFFNAATESRAPLFENVYISPRTRNATAENLEEEKITSFEGGYLLRAPKAKIRATLYYTQFNDGYDLVSFWHEDFRTFVNYSLSNIDRRHIGLEFGTELNLGQGWTANFAAALGQYYYTDRMKATISQDNSADILANNETVYSKDFFVSNGPQQAITTGLVYRSKNFWLINMSVNFFAKNYIAFNPARRTVAGVDLMPDDGIRQYIIDQREANSATTVDLFATKSWRVSDFFKGFRRNTFVVLNLGLSNILDNQDMVTNGFEQLRFDYEEKNAMKYPPKYYYGFGRTYFASIIVRFN